MADRGHVLTDELLKKLEKDIAKEYRKANREAAAKLKAYLEEDEAKRKVQESLLKAGKITQKDYNDWVFRHTMMGKRWKEMRDTLAQDYHNANKIALQIAKGRMPDVYALNANFGTYQLEHDGKLDTSFTLYNHDTAEYLLAQERELMPGPSARKAKEIAANKDLQWNKQKIQSAVLQGILQGESPYEVAKRLQQVGQMDYNAAVRYARTMTTNVQNAGRYQAFRRADSLGVDLTIEWQATLDGRTRHEHRLMHGQRRDVGEPFVVDGIEILWPAQPNYNGEAIPQQLIWNCRCTLLSWVKGFEGTTVTKSPKMGDMSFEEWQKATPHPDTQQDREQYEKYKKLLKGKAPKSYGEFRYTKYDNPQEWKSLKATYHKELYHKPITKNSPFKQISDKEFESLVAGARAQGAIIIRGTEWAEKHLGNNRASSIGNDILVFKKAVSRSDVHEELRHFWQRRTGFMSNIIDFPEYEILCEIDAKNYLITNRKKLRIPRAETEETMRELAKYEEDLKRLRGET